MRRRPVVVGFEQVEHPAQRGQQGSHLRIVLARDDLGTAKYPVPAFVRLGLAGHASRCEGEVVGLKADQHGVAVASLESVGGSGIKKQGVAITHLEVTAPVVDPIAAGAGIEQHTQAWPRGYLQCQRRVAHGRDHHRSQSSGAGSVSTQVIGCEGCRQDSATICGKTCRIFRTTRLSA